MCALLAYAGAAVACSRSTDDELAGVSRDATTVAAPSSSGAVGNASVLARGRKPIDFPSLPLSAHTGDTVLVPLRSNIEQAEERGIEEPTFVFVRGTLERIGEHESQVRWLTEQRARVDNLWIVPLRKRERAQVGDVVLTSWASGSGLQRAIVVDASDPVSPKVRYLDLPFADQGLVAPEALPASTFHVLRVPGEVGTSVACRNGARTERVIVVKRANSALLGLGFAGKLRRVQEQSCDALPIAPSVKAGERVFVPVIGAFTEAKVVRVEAALGQVHVTYEFGNETKEQAFGYTNVALQLPRG